MKIPRFGRILSANAFGQIITILVSFGSVPLFLSQWDQNQYGVWILLSTIPAYLASADFGLGATTVTRILIDSQSNKAGRSSEIFKAAFSLLLIVACTIVTASGTVLASIYFFGTRQDSDILIAAFLLCVYAAFSLASPLIESQYKYAGHFATPLVFLNLMRLSDWILAWIFFSFDAAYSSTAAGLVISRVSFTLMLVYSTTKLERHLRWQLSFHDKAELKATLRHSGFFSLFPISNLIILQGSLGILGYFSSPAIVAIASTYRTLTRSITQLIALVNKSFWPEFSEAFGRKDLKTIAIRFATCRNMNIAIAAISCIFLLFFGQYIFEKWTHNSIEFDRPLFLTFLFGIFLTSFWQADWVLAMSTNLHHQLSVTFFIGAIVSFGALTLLLASGADPLTSIGGFAILSELTILAACKASSRKILRMKFLPN